MTAGDIYTILGSSSGTSGDSSNGTAGTSALLHTPYGVAVDSSGDLFVADHANNRVVELAASSGTQWGISMTADDMYTVAGTGTAGSTGDGGASSSAELNAPTDVALDSGGDLYIDDYNNSRIQEVAASSGTQWGQTMTAGDIYTVAGSSTGTSGSSGDGGAATSALLNFPIGVTVDSSGDLYIADTFNDRVQEVAATTGTMWGQSMTADDIYTVAGVNGVAGYAGDGSAATSAHLNDPYSVVVDPSGNLYIADSNDNRVQEVPVASGTQWGQSMAADDMYTVAGSSTAASGSSGDGGASTSALIWYPTSLGVDANGDIYFTDTYNDVIREIAPSHTTEESLSANDIYTIAGSRTGGTAGDNGEATQSEFESPYGVTTDSSGNVYIADTSNNRIQEVAATNHTQWGISMTAGDIYTILGSSSGTSGDSSNGTAGTSALLHTPYGVAVDSSGDLFVADHANNRVVELAASSGTQWGISMTADDMYTVAGTGTAGSTGDGGASSSAELNAPTDVALDSGGDLYIDDYNNSRIQEVAASSGTQWGQTMTAGDIYTVAGSSTGTSGSSGDGGAATSALLNFPIGVTVDSSGDLYIADTFNDRVQEVAATTGTMWGQSMTADDIYTVAGVNGVAGYAGDGSAATSAHLNDPYSVVVDPSGNLYIADSNDNRVQEVPVASGTQWGQSMAADDMYTVAGSSTAASGSSGDGGASTSALIWYPTSLGVDANGDIYFTDTYNDVIREIAPSVPSGSETVTTPSGYTLAVSKSTGSTTTDVYTHTVGASDTSVTLSYSTTAPKVAELAVYRGVDTSSPIDVSSSSSTSSGTSVSASSVTTTNAGDQLVFVAGAGQQGAPGPWSAPSGFHVEAMSLPDSSVVSVIADSPGPIPDGSTGSESATVGTAGQLTGVLLALAPGTVMTTTSYNADDKATLVTDPAGDATLTCYDGDGNVAQIVPPAGVAADSLTATSCPTSYPSDYGDRLATDATTAAYDDLGDKTTVTDPAPAGQSGYETTTYSYNLTGRLTEVASPPTSTGGSDSDTDYTYDGAGELLTETTGDGTATAATTSYCYDPNGDKTASVAPDGNTSSVATCSSSSPYETSSSYQTGYSYDSLGEVVSTTAPATSAAPSGQTTTATYDLAGNELTSEDPNGVTTTNTYTPLNQIATVSYSGSAAHSVDDTYDADGNKTGMTDASGTSSYSYDPFGELLSDDDGAGKTVSYSYDALGNVTQITYPLGGAAWANGDAVNYQYDAASQLTSVTDFASNTSMVTHTADGLPSSVSLGSSGDTISTSYDPTDSPSSITLSDGSTLQKFTYSDTPSGAIASETDTPSSSLSPADYSYDAQTRVTSMTPGSGATETYGEDASGDLTTLPTGASTSYDAGSELTSSTLSATTTDYSYDADGDRTEALIGGTPTVSATYNGATELTSYDNSAADTTSATYDGTGLRTSATTTPTGGGSSTQNFVWDVEASTPLLLLDSTNAYIYGTSGTPMEQVNLTSGAITYLVSDALGSVRGVVSSLGGLNASTSYDAFGNPETMGGLAGYTPFGFAGGYTDPTGLVYLIHRYYDPTTGQFVSMDPAVSTTLEPYGYAEDDPVNETDPTGMKSCNATCQVDKVIAAAAQAIAETEAALYYINPPAAAELAPAVSSIVSSANSIAPQAEVTIPSVVVDPSGTTVPVTVAAEAQEQSGPTLEATLTTYDGLQPQEAAIINHESGFNTSGPLATNASSGAFGLGQIEPENLPDLTSGIDVENGQRISAPPTVNGEPINGYSTNPFIQLWLMRTYIDEAFPGSDYRQRLQSAYNLDLAKGSPGY